MEYLIHNIPPCPVFSFNPLPSSTSIFQVVWSACIYMQLGKDREGVKRDPRTMETLRGITAYPYTVSLSLLLFLLVRYFASPFKAWLNPPRSGEMSRLLPRWKATHESKGRKTERKGEKRMKKISSCVLYVDPTCSLSVQSSIYNRKGRRGSRTIRGALVD